MSISSIQSYFKDINKFPLLTKEEEDLFILRTKFGDEDAKNKLINSNLRFVVSIAKKFIIPNVEIEDLIQEGNLGLIKSIDKFDPSKGVKFLSYAVWWIKQSIYSYLNEHSRIIRLSLNQIRDNNKYIKEKEALIKKYENENVLPEDGNFSEFNFMYLDELVDDMSLFEILKNEQVENPDRGLIAESLQTDIKEMLSTLNERECKILKMYFGISYDRPYTLDEIGNELNLTRERIRQIKELTLNRLKQKPKFKVLIRYLE